MDSPTFSLFYLWFHLGMTGGVTRAHLLRNAPAHSRDAPAFVLYAVLGCTSLVDSPACPVSSFRVRPGVGSWFQPAAPGQASHAARTEALGDGILVWGLRPQCLRPEPEEHVVLLRIAVHR